MGTLRNTVLALLGVVALTGAGGAYALGNHPAHGSVQDDQVASTVTVERPEKTGIEGSAAAASYKDISLTIEGRTVTLRNGISEVEAAPGSASKIVTRYFGNEATGDLNGDGTPDVAFLLTHSGGGSGTFFYIVAALKTQDGYVGTNAVFLGDRIAPQPTEVRDGNLIVNYAEREPGAAMTTRPSVGVSKYLKVLSGRLAETSR